MIRDRAAEHSARPLMLQAGPAGAHPCGTRECRDGATYSDSPTGAGGGDSCAASSQRASLELHAGQRVACRVSGFVPLTDD